MGRVVGRVAIGLCVWCAMALPARSAAVEEPPYILDHTQVRKLHSKIVATDYELFVSLPPNYEASSDSYPVVLLLDADYSFAILHNIVRHFADRRDLPPMILVGVAYPGALDGDRRTYKLTRTRDYTPTHSLIGGYGPEFQKISGGGEKFIDFLAQELVPYLERSFRLKPNDRAIVGHSYGGLLATHALLTRPGLFQRFVIISPSYWYDNRRIYRLEAQKAKTELRGRAFFSVGEKEDKTDRGSEMVKDLESFFKALESRRHPDLRSELWIAPGETHNSVFPTAVTRGIRAVFSREQAKHAGVVRDLEMGVEPARIRKNP